ncbi:prothoracicotropic hormone-like [Hyposmocoma kahamanoa]|uniref:prothoracicotropic hormone-like n=1 Tax=Hyposmocoma kahamanoa TaxID=1477025 RepID=UPI000E6D7715|nr:prothoracicotropic hormone-like [Hyposmocoma kahamanoa]XP_026328330.1 prothoracicotropic hormone-like [Hyposmocoma kahamanoa]XP_026328331.1 prothoracicotropic hormone-like [Hyposmocoma kahamanoa]
MLSGSLTIVTACSSFLLIIQIFTPKVVAMRKLPDADEFMIENQRTRTHTRQNYVFQRDRDEEMSGGMENTGPAYVTEPLDPDPNPEELPALIVDYANMIRNDIILLDNSVETRTRKRGNVRSKYDDREIMGLPPCSCESHSKEINLIEKYGTSVYPSTLKTTQCNDTMCSTGYRCKRTYYNVIVLKKKTRSNEKGDDKLPDDFTLWVALKEKITTGCSCIVGGSELN